MGVMTWDNEHVMTNTKPPWKTLKPTQWWILNRYNSVSLRASCHDSRIFIKAVILRQVWQLHVGADSPSGADLFLSRIPFFHWPLWFAWCTDHHFLRNTHELCYSWLLCCQAAWRNSNLIPQSFLPKSFMMASIERIYLLECNPESIWALYVCVAESIYVQSSVSLFW